MKHDETLGQAPPQGTTDASATNRVDHGGCPSDLQPLIQRMHDEAAQCDVFGITKPAALLREAANALQHAANLQAMDEFAEVVTAGHLSDAERARAAQAMDVLRQIASMPRRTQEQRLAKSCVDFLDSLREGPNVGAKLETTAPAQK